MRLIILLFICFILFLLSFQIGFTKSGRFNQIIRNNLSDSSTYENLVIDSIIVDNRNIYDINNKAYDRLIFKLANKFHYKTSRNIIWRELLFKKGDRFSNELAEETSRNLRERLVIYDAWIEKKILSNGHLLIRVVTIDQWSLSSGLNFSREGNETEFSIGIREKNFVGRNKLLSFYYFNKSDEDDYYEMRFFDVRFLGKPYQVKLDYSNNPQDGIKRIKLSHPFYNLEQSFSFNFDLIKSSRRRDIYQDTAYIARSFQNGDQTEIGLTYRMGKYKEKYDINLSYKYLIEKNSDKTIFSTHVEDSNLALSSFPDDSIYHQFRTEVGYSNFDYVKFRRIDGYGYTEDFVLGYFIQAGFARAFKPKFNDYEFDFVNFSFSRNLVYKSNLLFFDYGHTFTYRGSDNFRHITFLSTKFYNHSIDFITFAFRGIYLSDWNKDSADRLILGGTTGIRGFEKYYRTGSRRAVFNLEGRFFPGIKLLSLLFGGIVFADLGNIWKTDEPLTIKDFNVSIGTGLRLAFEKSSKVIFRFDFAYSDDNHWELSFGTNQYFQAIKNK